MSAKKSGVLDDAMIEKLARMANEAKLQAYCPYSKFHVGAALLCEGGQIYTGSNVENASFSVAICAERVAMCKAVSEGHMKFTCMALATDMEEFTAPCGACRQFLAEFATDWNIYSAKSDMSVKCYKLSDILPYAFTPDSLLPCLKQ